MSDLATRARVPVSADELEIVHSPGVLAAVRCDTPWKAPLCGQHRIAAVTRPTPDRRRYAAETEGRQLLRLMR
jgi:hypothetical protein